MKATLKHFPLGMEEGSPVLYLEIDSSATWERVERALLAAHTNKATAVWVESKMWGQAQLDDIIHRLAANPREEWRSVIALRSVEDLPGQGWSRLLNVRTVLEIDGLADRWTEETSARVLPRTAMRRVLSAVPRPQRWPDEIVYRHQQDHEGSIPFFLDEVFDAFCPDFAWVYAGPEIEQEVLRADSSWRYRAIVV